VILHQFVKRGEEKADNENLIIGLLPRSRLSLREHTLLLVLRLCLGESMLLEQRIDLLGRPEVVVHLALLGPAHRRELDLLRRKLCRIHRLAQHLDRQLARLLEVAVFVVVLLQQTLRRSVVGAHACRLPATVVSGRVGLVELELPLVVPTSVDERDTEGSETTVLRVALLQIAQAAHELLAGNVGVVGEEVLLGGLAGVVDEDVGVGGHASDGGDHVAIESVSRTGVLII
jgi:hypothetical protein